MNKLIKRLQKEKDINNKEHHRYLYIENKKVGHDKPAFIIAEAGVNHNGSFKLAKKLIDAAKEAKVDAVKFQIWNTESLILRNTRKVEYQDKNDKSKDQYEMIKKLELTLDEHKKLIEYCNKKKIMYLCTPTDTDMVDFLIKNGIKTIKVGSGELTNHEFLSYVAKKSSSMIFSVGMGNMDEVKEAVAVVSRYKKKNEFAILHCTSEYPAPLESLNLRVINSLKKIYPFVGYSDHTPGIFIAPIAVALGACIIEKHFSLDKNMEGPDHKASLNPDELKELVRQIRKAETALGNEKKIITKQEILTKKLVTRSAVAKKQLKAGTILKKSDIDFKRPGDGILSKDIWIIIGKKLRRNLKKDEKIRLIDLG